LSEKENKIKIILLFLQWSPNALVVNASRIETTFACRIRRQFSIVDIAISFVNLYPDIVNTELETRLSFTRFI